MAQIHEEILIIKLSKLVKNSDGTESVITEEVVNSLEQVTQELVGSGIIVEVEKA